MKKRTYEASNAAKRQICTVLKELMTQKPLNRITVAEIMRGCGMARQHFYYHFDSMGRDHLKRFFQTDIRTIIQSTIRLIAAELGYEAGEQELTMLTQFYVGALVSIVEDWLLGEIQGTPEELIRFVDHVLRDHVRGAGLRLSQAGPGAAPLLEPDHCAGPVSK